MQIFWFDLFLTRCWLRLHWCYVPNVLLDWSVYCFIMLLVCSLCIFLASAVSFFRKLQHRHSAQSYLQPDTEGGWQKAGMVVGGGNDEVFAAKKPHIFYGMHNPHAGMEWKYGAYTQLIDEIFIAPSPTPPPPISHIATSIFHAALHISTRRTADLMPKI